MFNEYPYVNLQDVNLDWILKHIKDLEINLQDFVKLNTIKYADPIIWNITTQYETNTVVIDGNTGTAYISVQPVPAGVALTNTDYWTVVFTLNLTTSNQNITFRDDGTNVVATFASVTGDWLLWNFYLYRVTQPISVNTAYVEGFNIERFTVELFIKDYINSLAGIIGDINDLNTTDKDSVVDAINEVLGIIGDLSDLNTTDKDSAVDAINEVLGTVGELNDLNTTDKDSAVDAINEVLGTVGDLNDLNTTDKDSVVDAINEVLGVANRHTYLNVEKFGAVGDGITDDTAAIQAAINAASSAGGGVVFLPHNTAYKTTNTLTLSGKVFIMGDGLTIIDSTANPVFNCYGWYGGFQDIRFTGNATNNAILFDANHINPEIPYKWRLKHIEIYNFAGGVIETADSDQGHYVVDLFIEDVLCYNNHGNSFHFPRSRGFMTFRNCKVDNTYNDSYTNYVGFYFRDFIGLELEFCDVVASGRTNLTPQYLSTQVGFEIIGDSTNGWSSVWMKRCVCDSFWGRAFYLDTINLLEMFECEAFACYGRGFDIENSQYINIANMKAIGAKGLANAPSDANGLTLVQCNYVNINNLVCRLNNGRSYFNYQSNNVNVNNVLIDTSDIALSDFSGTSVLYSNVIINSCTTSVAIDATSKGINLFVDGVYSASF